VKATRFLLAKGADANARTWLTAKTALHEAAMGGHPEVVKALLDARASPCPTTNRGATPLLDVEGDTLPYKRTPGHKRVAVLLRAAGCTEPVGKPYRAPSGGPM
jgi:ankyrin repeat protein